MPLTDQQRLAQMRRHAATLLRLVRKMTTEVPIRYDDNFGFMALTFLSKQIDHMGSVLRLDASPDVALVVRAMLEGLCQLKWAAKDRKARSQRWREYAWVHDWRTMKMHREQGERVSPGHARRINRNLKRVQRIFLARKAADSLSKGKKLPSDPYHSNWTGHPVDQIFAAVRAEPLYAVYKSFSDWQHWSPGGLGTMFTWSDEGVVYSPSLSDWSLPSLAIAFQCLVETADVVESHLGLGFRVRLERVKSKWIAEMTPARSNP